jgi:hypothetical protein
LLPISISAAVADEQMMGTIDIDPVRRFALGGDALTEEAWQ